MTRSGGGRRPNRDMGPDPEDDSEERPRYGAAPGSGSSAGARRSRPDSGMSSGSARSSGRDERGASSGGLMARYERFQTWLSTRRVDAVVEPEKIEPGRRLMAIGIDFGAAFLASMIVMMIPLVNRALDQNLVMISLMCVRDYFYGGRGLGKNIMGLRVVDIFSGQSPGLKQVLVRNLVYLGPLLLVDALHLFLQIIPVPQLTALIGQSVNLLATLYVLVILPVECYRGYQRDDSMRLGDELAGTCILEAETDFSSFLPK